MHIYLRVCSEQLKLIRQMHFGDVYEHIIFKKNFLLSVIGCQNFKCRLLYVNRNKKFFTKPLDHVYLKFSF